MIPAQVIAHKRDGGELSRDQIRFFVQGFAEGSIPDYQMSALAMAIFLNGMTTAETADLTEEMLESGTRLSWPDDGKVRVDKHSTGGVGDKISIPLAPLLACCGLQVPMLSGRGLGATGGTLDKLESIPGFRTNLSLEETERITQEVGCVITGASAELAPADRKLYALRDVTATVPSIPLITASIMSKKLAESLDALVLDVKFGSGAFMKTREQATALAHSLVDTGNRMGVKTSASADRHEPAARAHVRQRGRNPGIHRRAERQRSGRRTRSDHTTGRSTAGEQWALFKRQRSRSCLHRGILTMVPLSKNTVR